MRLDCTHKSRLSGHDIDKQWENEDISIISEERFCLTLGTKVTVTTFLIHIKFCSGLYLDCNCDIPLSYSRHWTDKKTKYWVNIFITYLHSTMHYTNIVVSLNKYCHNKHQHLVVQNLNIFIGVQKYIWQRDMYQIILRALQWSVPDDDKILFLFFFHSKYQLK